MDVETKGVGPIEIKDADRGEVEAVVATIGVVDHDSDVITHDAITNGVTVKMSAYGHDSVYGAIPVGKGVIAIEGNKAIFRGRLFLATARGRETFDVLKEMGSDQEWSFGFRVLGSEVPSEEWRGKGADRILTKLDAFEVSPVLIGAGKGTQTMAVKSAEPDPGTEAKAAAADQAAAEAKAQADVEAKSRAVEANIAAAEEYERLQRTFRHFGSR
jgi:hypothetical protein